jgi:hypothetical protein
MDQALQTPVSTLQVSGFQQAWQMVLSELRLEMDRAFYETWVQPLHPQGYKDGVFTITAYNPYERDWVESCLQSRITRLLEGLYHVPVKLRVEVNNQFYRAKAEKTSVQETREEDAQKPVSDSQTETEDLDTPEMTPAADATPTGKNRPPSARKVMLARAYGSQRAAVIQPERGLFVTLYFLHNWTPIIGHSAVAVILAARSMCYWNPMTGELRNEVETEIGELAKRAAASVRTVKTVLNDPLVKGYFLRYRVRRLMTPNGVRTAGILLQVRMDDPLTPDDQQEQDLVEEEHWYSPMFEGEEEEE